MATTPTYFGTPWCPSITISVANTARNGTGTIVSLGAAPAGGGRIDDILFTAQGVTTAGFLRIFKHDGTTYRLFDELVVAPITPSPTLAAWRYAAFNLGIVLEEGSALGFSTEKAETFNVVVTRGGKS